jgi:hypothetical protein
MSIANTKKTRNIIFKHIREIKSSGRILNSNSKIFTKTFTFIFDLKSKQQKIKVNNLALHFLILRLVK